MATGSRKTAPKRGGQQARGGGTQQGQHFITPQHCKQLGKQYAGLSKFWNDMGAAGGTTRANKNTTGTGSRRQPQTT